MLEAIRTIVTCVAGAAIIFGLLFLYYTIIVKILHIDVSTNHNASTGAFTAAFLLMVFTVVGIIRLIDFIT